MGKKITGMQKKRKKIFKMQKIVFFSAVLIENRVKETKKQVFIDLSFS